MCPECHNNRAQKKIERRAKEFNDSGNPSRIRQQLKAYRGFGIKGYKNMLLAQGNACAICRIQFGPNTGRPIIDHNHKTSKVRGLLCTGCNTGIGHLKDHPAILGRASEYLRSRGFYGKDPLNS